MGSARAAVIAAAAVAALIVGGCGEVLPDVGEVAPVTTTPAPAETADRAPRSEDPAYVRRLRRLHPGAAPRGAVVVVDVTGDDLVDRPRRIEFAKDGTLNGLRWTGWGSSEAVGRGTVTLQECAPSCARGLPRDAPEATIRLRRLKRCAGRRFYDLAEVTYGTGDGQSAARAYIGAPC